MTSRNLSKEKREKLIAKIQEQALKVDDETRAVFNEVINELNKKKYGLVWEEHSEEVEDEMQAKIPVFVEDKKREIKCKDNESYNFILEGDNLHSLKLLEKTHKNKIDVIYIDPPYNTLINDFKYNDKYVNEDDNFKHSKWLSFMERRLKIAKRILNENGLIFISIDEHELFQLKLLCDEIFGEKNYVECFTRNSSTGEKTSIFNINTNQDYVLLYAKNNAYIKRNVIIKGPKKTFDDYSNPDNDSNGPWKKDSLLIKIDSGRYGYARYPIENPYTKEVYLPPVAKDETDRRQWHYVEETFNKLKEKGQVVFERNKDYKGNYGFYIKKYLKDVNILTSNINSLIFTDSRFQNANGTRMLKKIFNKNNVFPYSKPVELIKQILLFIDKKDLIALDFFAGSGTTGQAIIELNKEDGGQRRFILCTNNENSICEEVTYPRIKTVITGKRNDGSDYTENFSTNLKYYKTSYINKKRDGSVPKALINHIKELIQLENNCDIDNKRIRFALSEEELDDIFRTNLKECTTIYIPAEVLLSAEQKEIVRKKRIEVINIPEYYFSEELKEVDEI